MSVTIYCPNQMKALLQSILLFTSISSLFGGAQLLYRTDGSSLGMSTELLRYAPFEDFFIPGLFLFTVLGLGSLAIFISGIKQTWYYARATKMQGILLLLWLIIQIMSIRTFSWLQVLMALIAICLILIPSYLRKHRS